jgi:dihydrofolate reductase
MGRKTWESLPFKPLKDRLNIVVSRDPSIYENTVETVEDAIALAGSKGYFRIYGIGGQGIYEAMLPMAHRLLITEVETVVEDADAFFPDEGEGWTEVGRLEWPPTSMKVSAVELQRHKHDR